MSRTEYKNPFFQIEILSYDEKRRAVLTENIQRLITSVQITENATVGESDQINQLQLELTQTDYLPDDGGLRPQDPKVFGEITNRPNALIDLRFDTEKGFTFVSKEEIESGTTQSSRNQSAASEPVIFLLQPENYIDIQWGYLEPFTERKRRFKIVSLDISGGASGSGKTIITATDVGYELNKATPSTGIVFQTSRFLPEGINTRNGEQDQPLSLQQTLFRIAKAFDAKLFYDDIEITDEPKGTDQYDVVKKYQEDSAPVDKAFRIPKGENYKKFIQRLAADFQSRVEFDTDEEGRGIIRFTKTEALYRKVQEEFNYMDGDGVVKNYKIVANDAMNIRKTSVANNEIKENVYVNERLTEADRRFPTLLDPEKERRITDNIGSVSGYAETHPSESEEAVSSTANNVNFEGLYNTTLNLVTIGHPRFKPMAFKIDNIGARYSGEYRTITVTHTISNAGYDCIWTAQRFDINEGGITSKEAAEQNETVREQLTEARE